MNNTLVSCVVPSYRRADTLKRAVNSILAQTYENLEILVIDDNIAGDEYSVKLHQIIESYKNDTRVRLLTQPKHINGAEARNVGIRAAKGEWVAFLDDDDEWLPTKIERQMSALFANPDCMGCSCYYHEYIAGKLVHSCPPYNTNDLNYKVFTRQVAMYTPTLIFRKDKLLEFGAFNNKLKRHQDLQLLLEFTFRNKMFVVPEFLTKVYNDSLINRPSLENFIEVKNDFFDAVDYIFQTYSLKKKKLIMSAHYYEIVFTALKDKNILSACKYIFKAGFRPAAICMLIRRMRDKKYINHTNS